MIYPKLHNFLNFTEYVHEQVGKERTGCRPSAKANDFFFLKKN